jgi:hypothetical protein
MFIGEALSGSRLGLKTLDSGIREVYFADRLLGELRDSNPDRLRPLSRRSKGIKEEYETEESC